MNRLLTRQDDWRTHRLQTDAAPPEGGVLFGLRRFALTTNNVTYAMYGGLMRYWDFYPSGEPGWGQVPVWGVAEVLASDTEGLTPGEAFYGFFPMAAQFALHPGPVAPHGFADASPHRAELAPVYHQVLRCSADPAWRDAEAPEQMLVRPLFATAYVLAGFLRDSGHFGAGTALITSASSKTALATAFCLGGEGGLHRVGLTSARHVAHVRSLGAYDQVLAYEDLAMLPAANAVVVLDFAGDTALRERLHQHFGDAMKHDAIIGATQAQPFARDTALPGPRPTFFFAPNELRRQSQALGRAQFGAALAGAQRAFLDRAFAPQSPWLRVDRREGWAAALGAMQQLCAGQVDPALGLTIELPLKG